MTPTKGPSTAFPAIPIQKAGDFLHSPVSNMLSQAGGVEMAGNAPRDPTAFLHMPLTQNSRQSALEALQKQQQQQPNRAQFSPVQFGSPAGAGGLSQFIAALKQGQLK